MNAVADKKPTLSIDAAMKWVRQLLFSTASRGAVIIYGQYGIFSEKKRNRTTVFELA